MKKFFYIMLVAILPMMAASFASCSDDKDLPDVDITLNVSEGVVSDGTIYVAQGDTIKIAAIDVVNNEAGKGATVTNVNYYWDGLYYAPSVFAPFGMVFPTSENTPLGKHSIDVTCTVLAVDKSMAVGALSYPVVVVADQSELPTPQGNTMVKTTSLKN